MIFMTYILINIVYMSVLFGNRKEKMTIPNNVL